MHDWHHRTLRPAEAAAVKPHTFLASSDGDVGGIFRKKKKRKRQPHLCDFLITCYTRRRSLCCGRWLTNPLWLVPSLLFASNPVQTLLEFILDSSSVRYTFFFFLLLHVQHLAQAKTAIFCSFSMPSLPPALNHTRPYTSTRLKYAPLKCCVQSSPQLMLRVSCCTLVERKYPLFKSVRSSLFFFFPPPSEVSFHDLPTAWKTRPRSGLEVHFSVII